MEGLSHDDESSGCITSQMETASGFHLSLQLEWDEWGNSEGNYVCILCGEPAAQRSLAA